MQKLDQRITKSLPPAWPEIRQDKPDMSPPIARYARILWKRR